MRDNALPTVSLDEDLEDADWIRTRRWDLPTALGPFLQAIQAGEQGPGQRAAVQRFLRLPAARMMPASLRSSLERAGLL